MPQDTPAAGPVDFERVRATTTLREAPAREVLRAAMRELGRQNAPCTLERLLQLMQVEEHFQTLLLGDKLEFLRGRQALDAGERAFALDVQRICLEAANGFQRFLRQREAWARARAAAELVCRVTGLALNAIHCFVKWGIFRAEPDRSVPWKQVNALYALAESEGFAQVTFVLHASRPGFKPSVQSIYLRTLMLEILNARGLTRAQVEIADGWLAAWCGEYGLDSAYSSRSHHFCVDLAAASGLHFVRQEIVRDSVRYLRADGLKAQLDEVQDGLRQGRLFAGNAAGAVFPIDEHVALLVILERLHQSMLAHAGDRIEERTEFESREVDVVVGMQVLIDKIRAGPLPLPATPAAPAPADAEMVEISPSGLARVVMTPAPLPAAPPEPDVQTWRVLDLSSKGYGLLTDKASADAVMLNGIIGIRDQTTRGWIAGAVVRKQPNRVRGEVRAGVEVLAYRPLCVTLRPVEGGRDITALYLPGLDTNGRLDSMLVRIADFSAGKPYRLEAGGAAYRIRMNRITRRGADWLKVRYEIEAKA